MSNTRVYVIVLLSLTTGPTTTVTTTTSHLVSRNIHYSMVSVKYGPSICLVCILSDQRHSPAKTTWNRHGFCCMPTSLTPQQESVPKSWSVTGVYRNTSIIDPFLWWRSLSMSKFSPELLNFHRKFLQRTEKSFCYGPTFISVGVSPATRC